MPGHPMSLRVHKVCVSPAASRRGLGPVLPARKSGDRPPQDCPACPPGLAGRSTTYLGTFRPIALVRPAGRCDGFTWRAVRPSKRLKDRRRYPWRAGSFCAIEYPRTEPGQPSRPARAAARRRTPGAGQRSGCDIPFPHARNTGRAKELSMRRNPNPRTSLKRLSELRSLALGAAFGALLADPMTVIHSWTELLDLLVFWR